ncbi:MAG: hypothetical protein V1820_03960 [archaeon]
MLRPWKKKQRETKELLAQTVYPKLVADSAPKIKIWVSTGNEEFTFAFGPGSQGYDVTPELLKLSVPAGKYLGENDSDEFPDYLVGALSAAAKALGGIESHTVEYSGFPEPGREEYHRIEIGAEGREGARVILSKKGSQLELTFQNYTPLETATEILIATLRHVPEFTRFERAVYGTADFFSRHIRVSGEIPEELLGRQRYGSEDELAGESGPESGRFRGRPPFC